MPSNYSVNNALISLELQVVGADQLQKASEAITKVVSATEQLRPVEAEIDFILRDETDVQLKLATQSWNQWKNSLVGNINEVILAIKQLNAAAIGAGRFNPLAAASLVAPTYGTALLEARRTQGAYRGAVDLNRIVNSSQFAGILGGVGINSSDIEDQFRRAQARYNKGVQYIPGIEPITAVGSLGERGQAASIAVSASIVSIMAAYRSALYRAAATRQGLNFAQPFEENAPLLNQFVSPLLNSSRGYNLLATRAMLEQGLPTYISQEAERDFGVIAAPSQIKGLLGTGIETTARTTRNPRGSINLFPEGRGLFGFGRRKYNTFEEDLPPEAAYRPGFFSRIFGGGGGGGSNLPPGLTNVPGGAGGRGPFQYGPSWGGFSGLGGGVGGALGGRFASLGLYATAAAVIYPLASNIYDAFHRATELEVILKRIQGIYGGHTLGDQLKIQDIIVTTAKQFSENINEVAMAAQQFAQEQLPFKEMANDLNAAAAGAKAFGTNITTVADYIIAVRNATQGRVGGQQATDIVAATVARGAVSPQNVMSFIQSITPLLEEFSPTTGPLSDIALEASLAQTGARQARLSGQQLRTTLQSLVGKLGSASSVNKIQDVFGVNLGTAESGGGDVRPLINIINDLSDAYNRLIKTGQSGEAGLLARTLFGPRQLVPGTTILKDWKDILKSAVDITNDSGAAARQAALQLDTYNAAIIRIHNSLELIAKGTQENLKPIFNSFLNIVSTLVEKFTQLNNLHGTGILGGYSVYLGGNVPLPNDILNENPSLDVGQNTAGRRLGQQNIATSLFRSLTPLSLFTPKQLTLAEVQASLKDKTAPLNLGATGPKGRGQYLGDLFGNLGENTELNIQLDYIRRSAEISRSGIGRNRELTPQEVYQQQSALIAAQKVTENGLIAAKYYDQIARLNQAQTSALAGVHQTLGQFLQGKPNPEIARIQETYDRERAALAETTIQERLRLDYNTKIEEQQALQTEQLSLQEEHYKRIKEITDIISNGLAKALTGLPGAFEQGRGGINGRVGNIHPLSILATGLIYPFGESLYNASTKDFAKNLSGAGSFFANKLDYSNYTKKVPGGGAPSFLDQILSQAQGFDAFGGGNATSSGGTRYLTPKEIQRAQAIAAIGNIVGASAGAAVGGNSAAAQTGAAIGGIIGQIAIPIPGVGAAVGSIVGGVLGGFLGPKPKPPPETGTLTAIADNTKEQVRLLENTNRLLQANFVSFNVPTGFRLPSYQPSLFGGGISRGTGGGVNNTAINVQVNVGGTNVSADKLGATVAQAVSDRLELESRSAGIYNPRLIYG